MPCPRGLAEPPECHCWHWGTEPGECRHQPVLLGLFGTQGPPPAPLGVKPTQRGEQWGSHTLQVSVMS